MSEIFKGIPEIKFEGKDSKNPLAFKYYDPKRVIMGKTMEEHLPFAMAWWHNLGANGVDMFGLCMQHEGSRAPRLRKTGTSRRYRKQHII